MTIALFPGSFDPVTNGHVDTIKQASLAFDKVYVVVMTNTHKHGLFSPDERVDFIKDAVQNIKNVEVLEKPETLTVDLASKLGVNVLVRGARNIEDFTFEQQIASLNREMSPNLPTALFFTKPEDAFVASSMVKEIAKFGGDITKFLPEKAAKALSERLKIDGQEKNL